MSKSDEKAMSALDCAGKPVDLEFESCLQKLEKALDNLVANNGKSSLQLEFFRRLRAARFIFRHKILLFYGARYRDGKSAKPLLRLAEKGIQACRASKTAPQGMSHLLESYASEIRRLERKAKSMEGIF